MAGVAPSARRAAVDLRGRLTAGRTSGFVAGAVLAAFVVSCETRDVYLVPKTYPIESQPPGTGGATSTGGMGGMMYPPDSGLSSPPRPLCETDRYAQEPIPLGVYIMVDQSAAMQARWADVSAALSQFVGDSDRLGKVSLGIQYYAIQPSPILLGEQYQEALCDWHSYSVPYVPIAPIADAQLRIQQSLTEHGPSALALFLSAIGLPAAGNKESPIDAALTGAIDGARTWAQNNERDQAKALVLVVTDKIASLQDSPLCQPTLERAARAANSGMLGVPAIPTYVLGVGDPNPDLDAVAAAGGTSFAYVGAAGAALASTLQLIREKALPCDVNAPDDVDAVAGNLFNVDLVWPGHSQRFGRVRGSVSCNAERNDEWYTDAEVTGETRVRLCPNTCTFARSLPDAKLDVVLGCPTVTID